MMYTNGLEIGNDTYLLSEENGKLTVIKGNNGIEEIEEYIELNNTLEEKQNYEKSLQDYLSHIDYLDETAKGINVFLSFMPLICASASFITGHFDLTLLITMTIIFDCIGAWLKVSLCSTKKTRRKEKNETNSEITKTQDLIKNIEKQINDLKEKNEYKELEVQEETIVPITTVENKKEKAKMRVLKLN